MSNVLAPNGEIAPAPTVGALQRGVLRRPVELTGAKQPRPCPDGAAVDDPKRHFATANYRIAKSLFDNLVGSGKQGLRNG